LGKGGGKGRRNQGFVLDLFFSVESSAKEKRKERKRALGGTEGKACVRSDLFFRSKERRERKEEGGKSREKGGKRKKERASFKDSDRLSGLHRAACSGGKKKKGGERKKNNGEKGGKGDGRASPPSSKQ